MDQLNLIITEVLHFSDNTVQFLGQLNTTYVQTDPQVSPDIYATLKTPGVYIQ